MYFFDSVTSPEIDPVTSPEIDPVTSPEIDPNGSNGSIIISGSYAQKFSLGSPIDGTGSLSTSYTYLNIGSANDANWAAGITGFLGVKFDADDGAGTSIVFGWIRASFDVGNSITVYDFAYESNGGAILAGDLGSAIPEPSTYAALAGLLAGTAALYAKRRRATLAA